MRRDKMRVFGEAPLLWGTYFLPSWESIEGGRMSLHNRNRDSITSLAAHHSRYLTTGAASITSVRAGLYNETSESKSPWVVANNQGGQVQHLILRSLAAADQFRRGRHGAGPSEFLQDFVLARRINGLDGVDDHDDPMPSGPQTENRGADAIIGRHAVDDKRRLVATVSGDDPVGL